MNDGASVSACYIAATKTAVKKSVKKLGKRFVNVIWIKQNIVTFLPLCMTMNIDTPRIDLSPLEFDVTLHSPDLRSLPCSSVTRGACVNVSGTVCQCDVCGRISGVGFGRVCMMDVDSHGSKHFLSWNPTEQFVLFIKKTS